MTSAARDTDLARSSPAGVAAVQDRLLRGMVALCAVAHPAYRRMWAGRGIDPGTVTGVDQLHRLPVTGKADYTTDPDGFRLRADLLPEDEAAPWDVMYTTGSTGRPAPFHSTTYDYYNILALQRRVCAIRGIGPDDTIANLYPYTPRPHGAFTRCCQAAAVIGAQLVVGGGGRTYGPHPVHRSTAEVVDLLRRTQPTVLWGVVSYLRRVLIETERSGVRLERVRLCAVSGEPLSTAMRTDIVDRLARLGSPGATVNDSLGATEMQAGLVECVPGSGLHNPSPELFYVEAVDGDGMPVAPGTTGMLAITHLDRRGTVLLRYLTGDQVTLSYQPCPHCGRSGGRVVSAPRRSGRLVKVRGMLVDSDALVATVESVLGALDFQVRVVRSDPADPLSMDSLVVLVAAPDGEFATPEDGRTAPDAERTRPDAERTGPDDERIPALARRVVAAIKQRTNVTPEIRLLPGSGGVPGAGGMKAVRFVDDREES